MSARRPASRKARFAPLAAADARILILGSLPGEASLAAGEYYAHPQNSFWPIMHDLVGADGDYAERCRRLTGAGIALWDVVGSAVRPGSLDAAIRQADVDADDFRRFLRQHAALQLVVFNGGTAETLFRRRVLPGLDDPPRMIRLPSTSPAFAAMPVAEKRRRWTEALRPLLRSG